MEVLSPIETVSACENKDKQSNCHWQVYEQQPCPSLPPAPQKNTCKYIFLFFSSIFTLKVSLLFSGKEQNSLLILTIYQILGKW